MKQTVARAAVMPVRQGGNEGLGCGVFVCVCVCVCVLACGLGSQGTGGAPEAGELSVVLGKAPALPKHGCLRGMDGAVDTGRVLPDCACVCVPLVSSASCCRERREPR
jgi:hypothetical protein